MIGPENRGNKEDNVSIQNHDMVLESVTIRGTMVGGGREKQKTKKEKNDRNSYFTYLFPYPES